VTISHSCGDTQKTKMEPLQEEGCVHLSPDFFVCLFGLVFFVVLGLELRAYTLSYSTNPFL
jgi:hypothetical protein